MKITQFSIFFLFIAVCLIGFAAPFVLGYAKPDAGYGIRTPETLASHANWILANMFAAKRLMVTGAVLAVAAAMLPTVKRVTPIAYSIACLSILLIGSMATILATIVFIQSLPVHHRYPVAPLPKWDIACIFIIVGIMISGLAAPLVLRAVRPNLYYGFRTRQTLDDEMVWYRTNEYCGRMLLGCGLLTAITAFVLAPVPQINPLTYYVVCTIVFITGTIFSTMLGWDYMKTISGH